MFNELTLFDIHGEVDEKVFGCAFQDVVDHTDALRTVVRTVGGLPTAEVLDDQPSPTNFVDLSLFDDREPRLDDWARQHVDSVFDLSQR